MYLVVGVLCLSICFLLYVFTLLSCRNPSHPRWTSDTMVGSCIIPFAVGLLVVGVSSLCHAFFAEEVLPSAKNWGAAGGIVIATVVLYLLLGVRKRLAIYREAAAKSGNVVNADFHSKQQDQNLEPPFQPQSGGYRKAA